MPFVLTLSQAATLSVQPEEARRVRGQRKGQLQRLFPFFPSLGTSKDWNHPLPPGTLLQTLVYNISSHFWRDSVSPASNCH